MFIRPSAVFLPLVTLSSLVAAAPGRVARGDGGDGNVCGNKNLQCCTSTYENNASNVNLLQGLLGIVLDIPIVGGLLGLGCSPITVVGLGGNSCSQQSVCCDNVEFNGLINIGCININL